MMDYIKDMGPMGLFCIIILAYIIFLGLKNAYLLFIKKPLDKLNKLGRSINAMLFWGGIIVILCFIGTSWGLQTSIDSIFNAFGMYNNEKNIEEKTEVVIESDEDAGALFIIESDEDVETLVNMDPKPDIVIDNRFKAYKEPNIFPVFLGAVEMLLKLVIFSLTTFMIISIVWYFFTWKHRKLLERSMKEKYSAD